MYVKNDLIFLKFISNLLLNLNIYKNREIKIESRFFILIIQLLIIKYYLN